MTKLTLEGLEQVFERTFDRAFAPLEREVAELKQTYKGVAGDVAELKQVHEGLTGEVAGLRKAVNRIEGVPYPPSTSRRGREPVAHSVTGPIYRF
jgi:hypothetical protein